MRASSFNKASCQVLNIPVFHGQKPLSQNRGCFPPNYASFALNPVFGGSVAKRKDDLRTAINGYFTGFSDFEMERTSCVGSGDCQCAEWIVTGMRPGAHEGCAALRVPHRKYSNAF